MRWIMLFLVFMALTACNICKSPYTTIDDRCCLDLNENSICDDVEYREKLGEVKDVVEDKIKDQNITNLTNIVEEKVADVVDKPVPPVQKPDPEIIDYEISSLRIENSMTDIRDDIAFYVSDARLAELLSAELEFTIDCASSPEEIYIFVEDKKVYSNTPDCNEKIIVEIPGDYVTIGRNKVVFISQAEDIFITDVIARLTTISEGAKEQELPSVLLEKKSEVLNSYGRLEFTNHRAVSFKLDEMDLLGSVSLQLAIGKSEGELNILVNDKPLPEESIKTGTIAIPKEFLREGKNNVDIIILS